MDIEDMDRDIYERGKAEDRKFNWRRMQDLEEYANRIIKGHDALTKRVHVAEIKALAFQRQVKGLRAALKIATKDIRHPARFARVMSQ